MSERADDDVRGEQRRAARQLKQQQQQIQRGESSTAMATVAERRSLPSPEIMLGQPWSNWVDAAKLHGNDGAESEESFKEFGKNREAMRLCREDMSIFGQCPAQDDFYLVMCSHCSQVVKPQAFQAHYERRHSSASKPPAASAPSSAFSLSTLSRNRGSGTGLGSGVGSSGGGVLLGRPSSGGSGVSSSSSSSVSSNSRLLKPAKEKLPGVQRRAHSPPFRMLHTDKILSPAVKVEKMHLKVDSSAKLVPAPSTPSSSSSATVSSNCTTSSSSSAFKPGPICSSIPKAPHLASGQIPNGKGHASLSSLDRKPENSGGAGSRRHLYKRLSEREFNPDIHCGVLDITARKPCTRSLTCKTHSLSQRRAVLGRRKRFDTLLAEHKSKARERELQQTTPPLRDPHPSAPRLPTHDPHLVANGPAAAVAADPSRLFPLGKPKPHNSGLPRLNSSISHGGGGTPGDPSLVHEAPHPVAAAPDGVVPHSSDEGENEEREDAMDKLDCHYSGYHPRPAAYCAFGSRMFAKSCYSFDRRWDRLRVTLVSMLDKHVNAQLWKKIPLALENSSSSSSSSSSAPAHRTSTNSHGSAPSTGFLGPPAAPPQPPYGQSYDGKSALSYGTTLSARASAQGAADHPAYGTAQARQVSSSPQMPSAHSSSSPSLAAGRALKSRSAGTTKTSSSSASFRPRDGAAGFSTPLTPGSTGGGGGSNGSGLHSTTTTSSNASFPSGKKRKNSSLLSSSHHAPSTNNASSFKKNCSSGSTYHALLAPSTSSSSSSSSSSHSGVHSVGLSCGPSVRTNSLSLKAEPSGGTAGGSSGPSPRGPPSGSPAESIKRMSVVMNSSDSTLSLGPFVHHQSSSSSAAADQHHHGDGRLEAKKRKGSPASSSLNSGGGGGGGGGGSRGGGLGGGGGGGGPGPGRPKVAKSPAINNIHGKHGRSVPGAPGLPSNSVLHQPKARP